MLHLQFQELNLKLLLQKLLFLGDDDDNHIQFHRGSDYVREFNVGNIRVHVRDDDLNRDCGNNNRVRVYVRFDLIRLSFFFSVFILFR